MQGCVRGGWSGYRSCGGPDIGVAVRHAAVLPAQKITWSINTGKVRLLRLKMAHIEEDYVIHHPSLEGPFKKDGREGESNISDLASRKGFYEGSTVECAICMDDEVPETMTSMNRCGHTFCNGE